MPPTPIQALAEHLLGQPVGDWLRERRPDRSYRRLAQDLYRATDGSIDVTDRTVAAWLAPSEPEPSAARAS